MRKRRSHRSRTVEIATVGFFAGAITVAVAVWSYPRVTPASDASVRYPSDRQFAAEPRGLRPVLLTDSAPVAGPAIAPVVAGPVIEADPLSELRSRRLALPVLGVERRDFRDSFLDKRDSTRIHEALDIMAPRNTPILAVEDGTIARLFQSKAGGTTVYQFDPAIRYVYYYAHLERYADGLQEGGRVERGQVLGYVGTSGNAPKDAPHLHFAIFRLTEKKQWWQGAAIDPYAVLH